MEKNEFPQSTSLRMYALNYAEIIALSLRDVEPFACENAFKLIEGTMALGGTVYVAGNGGSAAISEHLMCDFAKSAGKFKVHSLCSDIALLSALANDIGYDAVFAERLKISKASSNDLLILISSSGNSPNVLKAAEYASEIGMHTIGMTGFSGGQLRHKCNISIHVPLNNYGMVEDAHEMIMHCWSQWAHPEARLGVAPLRAPPADRPAK
jgi:D-sedoheptulose 7-phosphate isomerase